MKEKIVPTIMLTLLLTSLLTLAFNIQPVKAEPRTWIVDDDGPADFHTIQEAINAANPEDTVYVKAGTYYENLVVNKTLSFIGEGSTGIATDVRGGIQVMVNGVTITGFAIRQSGYSGVELWGSSGAVISGNNIMGNYYGVVLYYSSNNSIFNNNIESNVNNGVELNYSPNNSLSSNTIVNNGQGIRLSYSSNNNISNNNMRNNGVGIELWESSGNNMSGNNIADNEYGIGVYYSSNIIVYHNNFVNNLQQVYCSASIDIWDDGYPSGGNFWSDYNGTDLYSGPFQNETGSDGIGDTPYVIDVNNRDNYPLMAPWEPPIDWWPMLQRDSKHSGYSTCKIPNKPALSWSFSGPEEHFLAAPVVINGIVFIGSWEGNFYALNETNGKPIWSYPTGPVNRVSATVDEGKVFVGTQSGIVYCLDLEGNLIWNFTTEYNPWLNQPAPVWSSLNFDEEKVYFLTYGGFFYALNRSDGKIVWSGHPTATWTLEQSSPALYEGVVYFGSIDSWVYALNASDGSLIWKFDTDGSIAASPTVFENRVYIGSSDSNFYCIDAMNGSLMWKFTAEGPIYSVGAVFDGKVFFSIRWPGFYGDGGKLYALNASDGTLFWNATFEKRVDKCGPIVVDGKVFVGAIYPASDESIIHALNMTDGALLWSFKTMSDYLSCSFAAANNKLFVGSDKVYAFGEPICPVANFTWTPLSPRVGESVTFDASLSTSNGGTIDKYEWNFGDGENATGEIVTHAYFAAANYTVTLSVTDTEGLWDIEEKQIEVKPLPSLSLTIKASAGGTTDPTPGTYSYTVNSTVEVTAIPEAGYLFDYWELDSVNVGSANPYSVLMDKNHALKAVFALIPPPLSASISPLSASILVGQSVTFTSTVSGGYTPYNYQWYLNNALVSGATSNTWTFTPAAGGIYYIYLKVTDANGNAAQSETARITTATVPVGGYSIPLKVQTKAEPVLPYYIALIAALTAIFTKLRPKTKRKR